MNLKNLNNIETCQQILSELARHGLSEIVFCAGSRNAPFIACLGQLKNARIYSFFEERSAAFFALGRARALKSPVAVITTSGTAAAELLPACIEAFHSGVPLVLISADRPRKLRFTGAPQSMDQTGLMSGFVERAFDLEKEEFKIEEWSLRAPIHINICLDEPLLDAEIAPWSLPTLFREPALISSDLLARVEILKTMEHAEKPLILLSGLEDANEMKAALEICLALEWPTYAEACSGLRESSQLQKFLLRGGEQLLSHVYKKFDVVLRLGSVPTTRLWRDLENGACEVLSVSSLKFTGRSQSVFLQSRIQDFAQNFSFHGTPKQKDWQKKLAVLDAQVSEFNLALFERYPLAEPSLVRAISDLVEEDETIYVGNSLPIRHWDFAATHSCSHHVYANRGVNGIDGQLSSFLGLTASATKRTWCLVGDLTALYDMTAPWILKNFSSRNQIFVILNNGGGQIFHRIYHNPLFENSHSLNFSDWAKMWSLDYELWTGKNLKSANLKSGGARVIEVVPNAEQTQNFWNEHSEFVKKL